MMLTDGTDELFMVDRGNLVFCVSDMEFPFCKDLCVHFANTPLDGEMIINRVSRQGVQRYLIYDITEINAQSVGECQFNIHLQCILHKTVNC